MAGSPSRRRQPRPFTVRHYREYVSRLVFDDGEHHPPEPWQLDFVTLVFKGAAVYRELLQMVPEGNGKTTGLAGLGLYGLDFSDRPWIPVGAASRDQAKILYLQAKNFVHATPGLARRFQTFDGKRSIESLRNGGEGLVVRPWDPDTNDGAIPYPYALVDEPHRHPDMSLWRLWKGKLRKRNAQILGISTAGEPGSEFEQMRDELRERAVNSRRRHGATIYLSRRAAMQEFKLEREEDALDPAKVAKVNPLSLITADTIADDLDSPSFDIGDWKRLKCNIPARSIHAAITTEEWDNAAFHLDGLPVGPRSIGGLDVGWKWDTTACEQLVEIDGHLVLGEATILVPPRDGSTLHPDEVKGALFRLHERNPFDVIDMDLSSAEDLASWIQDELGVTVVDHPQGNDQKVTDYADFMRGLRTGRVKRVKQCPGLTRHAMNAVSRRLPRGDHRFDRPVSSRHNVKRQDQRVIDALDAAAMAVHRAMNPPEPENNEALFL